MLFYLLSNKQIYFCVVSGDSSKTGVESFSWYGGGGCDSSHARSSANISDQIGCEFSNLSIPMEAHDCLLQRMKQE